ncbi:Utrophin [Eumeta japonica]|uniref:Utrophin n=1 Tax=Eumeta variegata TaxID=151549 RepID=A0A4C1SRL1_EUMVA|nr:Utrophin [Eumeta japonica]
MFVLLKAYEAIVGSSSINEDDEREDVQKKTFAKWINSQLVKNDKPLVKDLFQDLRDGEILLSLLEILTAQQYSRAAVNLAAARKCSGSTGEIPSLTEYRREVTASTVVIRPKRERGRMRVHHINNVNTALHILEANSVKLVNISSNDIVDGNPKLILGLVWSIILHWQVHYHLKDLMSELHQTNLEKTLLAWCRQNTQNYSGVNVKNFTTSWSDGLAFNALIHRWRPHLFDYQTILRKHPNARLDHAFRLAEEHLGIDRLLDPEDVNTSVPDKKSIMMYLMCMFQSLPHSGEDVADIDASLPSESTSPLASPVEVPSSRPLSIATNASAELGGYGAALEEVLTWLLAAEDTLAHASPPVRNDLNVLKEQFHNHEKFLLELSEHQSRVGAVLEEGARLLTDGVLSREEEAEVRLQMKLLNERWEELRVKAMNRQSVVHAALMKGQQAQLENFRQWLTKTEDRISRMGSLQGGPRKINTQVNAVAALHADLQRQQPLVDSLANCVVVVDDDAQDNSVTEIEDQLTALGERWTHTCQWTLSQLSRLQALQAQWTALDQQYISLLQSCDQKENILKQMEANPASEIGEVLERIKQLQQIKHSINVQQQSVNAHLELTNQLIAECDEEGLAEIQERVEALQDRFDALLLIIDVQSQRIKDLGFEFNINTTEETSSESPMDVEVTKTITTTMTVENVSSSSPSPKEEDHSTSKKPRLSQETKMVDFQVGFQVFQDWADETEAILEKCKEDLEGKTPNKREISSVVERLEKEIDSQRNDFAKVEEIQQRLAKEVGLEEEAREHGKNVYRLKTRYERIQQSLLDIRNIMNLLEDKDNFYKNIDAFQKDLDDVNNWTENLLKDTPSNNQLIHLRNKIRVLKQKEIRVKELNA